MNLSCVFTFSNIDVVIVSVSGVDRGLEICIQMFCESSQMVSHYPVTFVSLEVEKMLLISVNVT